jgi:hypothetical protein
MLHHGRFFLGFVFSLLTIHIWTHLCKQDVTPSFDEEKSQLVMPPPGIQGKINEIIGGLAVKVFNTTPSAMNGYYPGGFKLDWPAFYEDLHRALILDAWKRYNAWAGPNAEDVAENERKRKARDESNNAGPDIESLGSTLLVGVHDSRRVIKRPRRD